MLTAPGRIRRTAAGRTRGFFFRSDHYYIGCHADNYYYKPYVSGSVQNGVISVLSNTNNSYGIGFPIEVNGGQKYTINATAPMCIIGVAYYDAEWNFISNGGDIYQNTIPATKTTPSNASYMMLVFRSSVGETYTYSDIMVEAGETASPYTEYTGQSYPVTFPATGKNLIHPTPYGGQLFNVGAGTDLAQTTVRASSEESGNTITVTVTHQWYGVVYSTDMLPPGTYNIHLEPGDEHCRVSSYVADKDFIALSRNAITTNNKAVTLTETARIVVTISNDNPEPGSVTLTNLQVESGGSYTAWEAFTNTIYGGTLDAVNGVLTVEWAYANLNSESAWGSYGTGDGFLAYVTISDMKVGNRLPGYCDMFPSTYSANSANIRFGGDDNVIRTSNVNKLGITDLSEWKEFIGTDGINICYPLATPRTYQLDPITVQTLIGNNTIWTDTNGENTIKYFKKG